MYYDYDEEEFYSDSKYQEQVENFEEAIKASVKSEILDEMNRLRTENEKLQGIKDHFDEVKRDYEKKKAECDRAVRNAEHNAKRMRIAELMKDHKVVKWKITWTLVYGQKCDKCDSDRNVEIKLPSGRVVNDSCECKTDSKRYYYPKRDREFVNLRFYEGKTQMEVAQEIGISQAQVSRLEKNALRVMRNYLR